MLPDRCRKRYDSPSLVRVILPVTGEIIYRGLSVPLPHLLLPRRVDVERLVVLDPAAHRGVVRPVERDLVAIEISEDPVLGMEIPPGLGIRQQPLAVRWDTDTDLQPVVLHHPREHREVLILDDLRAFEVRVGKHPLGQHVLQRLARQHRIHVGLMELRADHQAHRRAAGDEVRHPLRREYNSVADQYPTARSYAFARDSSGM